MADKAMIVRLTPETCMPLREADDEQSTVPVLLQVRAAVHRGEPYKFISGGYGVRLCLFRQTISAAPRHQFVNPKKACSGPALRGKIIVLAVEKSPKRLKSGFDVFPAEADTKAIRGRIHQLGAVQ